MTSAIPSISEVFVGKSQAEKDKSAYEEVCCVLKNKSLTPSFPRLTDLAPVNDALFLSVEPILEAAILAKAIMFLELLFQRLPWL